MEILHALCVPPATFVKLGKLQLHQAQAYVREENIVSHRAPPLLRIALPVHMEPALDLLNLAHVQHVQLDRIVSQEQLHLKFVVLDITAPAVRVV